MGEPDALVLVVEDYADARLMYEELLELSGYRVAGASTGHEAIELANRLAPDLILMDLSLPGIDGSEATRRLKRDPRTQAIPIIVLTGHSLASLSTEAKEAGCDAFIIKPCQPAALLEQIRALLQKT